MTTWSISKECKDDLTFGGEKINVIDHFNKLKKVFLNHDHLNKHK